MPGTKLSPKNLVQASCFSRYIGTNEVRPILSPFSAITLYIYLFLFLQSSYKEYREGTKFVPKSLLFPLYRLFSDKNFVPLNCQTTSVSAVTPGETGRGQNFDFVPNFVPFCPQGPYFASERPMYREGTKFLRSITCDEFDRTNRP